MKSSPPPARLLPEMGYFDKLEPRSSHLMKPHTESPGRGQGAEGLGGKTKEEIKAQISGSKGHPPWRGRCGSRPGGKPGTVQMVTVL